MTMSHRNLIAAMASTGVATSRWEFRPRPGPSATTIVRLIMLSSGAHLNLGTAEGAQKPADMLAGRGCETYDFIHHDMTNDALPAAF